MKAMEQPHDSFYGGAIKTIILTAFTWFMNFITHTDVVLLFILHMFQLAAAITAILVGLSTIAPPLKDKLSEWAKKFNDRWL